MADELPAAPREDGDHIIVKSVTRAGTPDVNGNVWPAEIFAKEIEEMRRRPVRVTLEYRQGPEHTLGATVPGKASLVDNCLEFAIQPVNDEKRAQLLDLFKNQRYAIGHCVEATHSPQPTPQGGKQVVLDARFRLVSFGVFPDPYAQKEAACATH